MLIVSVQPRAMDLARDFDVWVGGSAAECKVLGRGINCIVAGRSEGIFLINLVLLRVRWKLGAVLEDSLKDDDDEAASLILLEYRPTSSTLDSPKVDLIASKRDFAFVSSLKRS